MVGLWKDRKSKPKNKIKRPMQHKQIISKSLITTALCTIFALGLISQTQAQDKKADATGTWTWTMPGRNGGPDRKMSLKLKAEGDKLTGKLTAPSRGGETRDTDIKDGQVKGDEVSFKIVREMNGNEITTKYNGKVSGDTIKGKIEFERNGETQSRDWEAKRATDTK
jgi:hypothetical protein